MAMSTSNTLATWLPTTWAAQALREADQAGPLLKRRPRPTQHPDWHGHRLGPMVTYSVAVGCDPYHVRSVTSPAEREIESLIDEWKRDTLFLSSSTDLILHPAYQRIMTYGRVALGPLLRDLQKAPNHWFWALRTIAGENPVPKGSEGDVSVAAAAWLSWGRTNGLIR